MHAAQVAIYAAILNDIYSTMSPFNSLIYLKNNEIKNLTYKTAEFIDLIKIRNELVRNSINCKTTPLSEIKCSRKKISCDKCYSNQLCSAVSLSDIKSELEPACQEYFKKWCNAIASENMHDNIEKKERKEAEDKNQIDSKLPWEYISHTSSSVTLEIQKIKAPYIDENDRITLIAKCNQAVYNYFSICLKKERLVRADNKYYQFTISMKKFETEFLEREFESFQKLEWSVKIDPMYIVKVSADSLYKFCSKKTNSRDIIIDKKLPQAPADISKVQCNSNLNKDQNNAFANCLTTADFHLVLGTPGSGKSTLISEIIKALLANTKSKILIAAYTNNSLDSILAKLNTLSIKYARVNTSAMNSKVAENVIPEFKDTASLEKFIKETRVYASTLHSIRSNPIIQSILFDYAIIDEASLIIEPLCLGAISQSSKFIMIGDYLQLSPIVHTNLANSLHLEISLFERLCKEFPEKLTTLSTQYRMNSTIMQLTNSVVYHDIMKCATPLLSGSSLPMTLSMQMTQWIKNSLNAKLPAVFISTDKVFESITATSDRFKRRNQVEVMVIALLINALQEGGIKENQIAIITPFIEQVSLINKHVSNQKIETLTIDKSQGREFDCVILSMVKIEENCTLLKNERRINVALTRARKKLIIIGRKSALVKIDQMKKYIDILEQSNAIVNIGSKNELQAELQTLGAKLAAKKNTNSEVKSAIRT